MAHKFHKTQNAYMVAKVAYEAAIDLWDKDMEPYADLLEDYTDGQKFAQYNTINQQFRKTRNVDALKSALTKAEDNMMEWANKKAIREAGKSAHSRIIAGLMEAIKKPEHFRTRQKVVEMAARLA